MSDTLENLSDKSDTEISEFISALVLEVLQETKDPRSLFSSTETGILKLAEQGRYCVEMDVDLTSEQAVTMYTVSEEPAGWSCFAIADLLNRSFSQLSSINLIIYGFNLKYSRPYLNLRVGYFSGEKQAAIDLMSPNMKEEE